MEQDEQRDKFAKLPEVIQQEIKNLLVHDKFTQAKELYEKWTRSLGSKQQHCQAF